MGVGGYENDLDGWSSLGSLLQDSVGCADAGVGSPEDKYCLHVRCRFVRNKYEIVAVLDAPDV
jgi:hypothetical protein